MSTGQNDRAGFSPYRGLEPFDESDAAYFFGRERETRLITASLFASPLTLLYGASGVGKSSVLRAGVLPHLRNRRELLPIVFPTLASEAGKATTSMVLRGWQVDPLGGVKEATAVALYASAKDQSEYGRFQNAVLTHEMDPLGEFLAACHQISGRRMMIILDQFEEYSLYHPEDDAFAEQFPEAIIPGNLSVSFLVSMREDSLAKLDRFKGRIPFLWDSYRRIDPLDREAAVTAIRRPLDVYNRQQPELLPIEIEDAVVEKVLDDVQTENLHFEDAGSGTLGHGSEAAGRIETPYLQLVMMRLWECEQAEDSRTLRFATLQREGFAPQIVRTHLDRVMEQFTDDERDVAARVFHRLVTPSGAKIAFTVRDLAEYEAIDPEGLAPILQRLEEGSRRILRRVASHGDTADEPRYEIFHDRLGTAVLAWRAKHLKEQERERSQREEAEKKLISEQSRAEYRKLVDAAMTRLPPDLQSTWARLISYLVGTGGVKLTQSAPSLASVSQQPLDAVQKLLELLTHEGILRLAYGSSDTPDSALYEIAHDEIAAAMSEWHSRYVQRQTLAATAELKPSSIPSTTVASAPEPSPGREFPYRLVCDLLRHRKVLPFLGAGASMSARLPGSDASKAFPLSNRDLKEQLGRACEFPASEFESSDIAEVASYFVQLMSRSMLDDFLAQRLASTNVVPSSTHRFLAHAASRAPLVILTTNYDTLMEQALAEMNLAYDVLAYVADKPDQIEYARFGAPKPEIVESHRFSPEAKDRTIVVRLHGPNQLHDRAPRGYVITEEDQIDWLLRFTQWLPRWLIYSFEKNSFLSLGHSARDWSQRALLHRLYSKDWRGGKSWAVALNPARTSIMTWQRYRTEVYNVELNAWAARMESEIAGMKSA